MTASSSSVSEPGVGREARAVSRAVPGSPSRRRFALALWATGMALLAVTVTLTVLNGNVSEDPFFIGVALAMVTGYTTVGALLASRVPRNPIGWLLMCVGLAFVVTGLTDEYATYTYDTNPGALPFGLAAAWVSSWSFILVTAPLPLVLLLYPTGRVLSPRWRFVPRLVIVVAAVILVGAILNPGPLDLDIPVTLENPTGIESLDGVLPPVLVAAGICLGITAIASIVALVLRFRRARAEERQQIRWLAFVAVLVAVGVAVAIVATALFGAGIGVDLIWNIPFVLLGIGVPAAAGVAILRYRLYDLDVVVKKAVVFGILVALITGLTLAAFAVIGSILVGSASDSPAAFLGAGLVIGLLVLPLRRSAARLADRIVYGGRATPYEVLTEFSGRMGETHAVGDVLPRMARVLLEGTGADDVVIWLRVGSELRPAADVRGGAAPRPMPRGDRLPELPGDIAVEVRHQGELLGAISASMPANDPLDPTKERLIRDLASQAGLVLSNVRLIEDLRASRERIVAAQDQERRRLERDIHDGAQQQLVALAVKQRLVEALVDRDTEKAKELLAQLQADTAAALENLRDLARGIYPPLLADQGLAAALSAQARKAAVAVAVEADGIGRYRQESEAAVYFCCLEAIQNAAKYAEASRVAVRLWQENGELWFSVIDDGRGFDTETTRPGSGLQNMADRLAALDGVLHLESRSGEGTKVTGRIPVGSGA